MKLGLLAKLASNKQKNSVELIIFYMQSSVPSGKSSKEPTHRWGEIWGTFIAVATLTLPVSAIVHYSINTAQANPVQEHLIINDRQ